MGFFAGHKILSFLPFALLPMLRINDTNRTPAMHLKSLQTELKMHITVIVCLSFSNGSSGVWVSRYTISWWISDYISLAYTIKNWFPTTWHKKHTWSRGQQPQESLTLQSGHLDNSLSVCETLSVKCISIYFNLFRLPLVEGFSKGWFLSNIQGI